MGVTRCASLIPCTESGTGGDARQKSVQRNEFLVPLTLQTLCFILHLSPQVHTLCIQTLEWPAQFCVPDLSSFPIAHLLITPSPFSPIHPSSCHLNWKPGPFVNPLTSPVSDLPTVGADLVHILFPPSLPSSSPNTKVNTNLRLTLC